MLEVKDLDAGYGALRVLHSVSLNVAAGEVVAVVGSNGAGKTTLLRAVNGIVTPTAGGVEIDGHDVTGKPTEKMAKFGMTHVPENRLCFPSLTVKDNLDLGGWSTARQARPRPRARAVSSPEAKAAASVRHAVRR